MSIDLDQIGGRGAIGSASASCRTSYGVNGYAMRGIVRRLHRACQRAARGPVGAISP